jgi:hypothetical protein
MIFDMFPINEQSSGKGIGLGLDSFLKRFDSICNDPLQNNQAKAFAFIFYNFEDQEFRRVLKSERVFYTLDRLAGKNLCVFYLHTGGMESVQRFNTAFLSTLGIEEVATPPCVAFFKVKNRNITDVIEVQLNSADLIHGFHELYGVIERFVEADTSRIGDDLKSLKLHKSGEGIIALEVFRAVLKKVIDFFL